MDPGQLPELLGLCNQDIERLRPAGLAHLPSPTPQPEERVDYVALQQTFARMLAEGPFKSQTELARHLGARWIWECRGLKGVKKEPG